MHALSFNRVKIKNNQQRQTLESTPKTYVEYVIIPSAHSNVIIQCSIIESKGFLSIANYFYHDCYDYYLITRKRRKEVDLYSESFYADAKLWTHANIQNCELVSRLREDCQTVSTVWVHS